MRITGGSLRGRKLKVGRAVYRPTQDRVRKAIFDRLGSEIIGTRILDAFCGSGALGIEAISRGAEFACFVDKSSQSLKVTQSNLQSLGIEKERYELYRGDIFSICTMLIKKNESFDIIFVDPPYASGLYERLLTLFGVTTLLKNNGIVVVEHSVRIELPDIIGQLKIETIKRYGDTIVTYFRKGGS